MGAMANIKGMSTGRWLATAIVLNLILVGLVSALYVTLWGLNRFVQQRTSQLDGLPSVTQHYVWIEINPLYFVALFALSNLLLLVAYRTYVVLVRTPRDAENGSMMAKAILEQLRRKATMPIKELIGRKLVAIHVIRWRSEACNLAKFIYEFEAGLCIHWEEYPRLDVCLQCQVVEYDQRWEQIQRAQYDIDAESKVFGHTLIDVLMPIDEAERNPESFVIELSSGAGLAKVCGEPLGILPEVYVTDMDRKELLSMCK